MKIEIKQLVEDWVNETLEDGPQECILDGAWYNLIKITIKNSFIWCISHNFNCIWTAFHCT